MTRVAALDCGTNSLRLLIADVNPSAGTLRDVDRRMEIVRLGEGVERTGRIAPAAMARTLAVTARFARLCTDLGVRRVRFIATSASRDAANREEFTAGVRRLLGVTPDVITGEEEAALSFAGATRGLPDGFPRPALVVDIGGGSTEFALGAASRVLASCSIDIGCVRLTERHLLDDPPTPERLSAATRDIDAALETVAATLPLERTATLVGLAGSVTTVAAHALRLARYDPTAIHGCVLSVPEVTASCDGLIGMSRAQRSVLPYLHPGRVDVISSGALIWKRVITAVAERSGIDRVITSEHDILDGIAWSLAR